MEGKQSAPTSTLRPLRWLSGSEVSSAWKAAVTFSVAVIDCGGRVQDRAPAVDEILTFAKGIGPLAVIGLAPDRGKFGHGMGEIGGLAGIHADGVVEEIAIRHEVHRVRKGAGA